MSVDLRKQIANRLGVSVEKDGFIAFPKNVSRLKLDIGLSFSAPHAIAWLQNDDQLFVIGFEPLCENVLSLKNLLKSQRFDGIRERFLIIECALSDSIGFREIFVTEDKGQASFLQPKDTVIQSKRGVVTETVDNVMKLVNESRIHRIDYMKTDCQGFDLEVLKGAKESLERTVLVTCESDTNHYEGATNSSEALQVFMHEHGFEFINMTSRKSRFLRIRLSWLFDFLGPRSQWYKSFIAKRHATSILSSASVVVIDPTFVNTRFKDLVLSGAVTAHQFN